MIRSLQLAAALVSVSLVSTQSAAAQPLGTFRWQLGPFCNVLSLHVTALAGVYRLDGFDDQCGGARAATSGVAVVNANGTIGLGLTIVATPGDVALHVDLTLNPATLGGSWRDTAGNSGTLIFNPPTVITGPARPAPVLLIADGTVTTAKLASGAVDGSRVLDGSLGAADVNTTEIQRRVVGACASGQFVRAVGQDGAVTCGADGTGTGDITAVITGAGLVGGGTSGDVALAVSFGGPGTASNVARSDHTHALADATNTAAGRNGLAAVTNGIRNTAFGNGALTALTTGIQNTGIGHIALGTFTSGFSNTAVGAGGLFSLQAGDLNTAVGAASLLSNQTGTGNTAVGAQALLAALGAGNIAIGANAGGALVNGDGNIYVEHPGVSDESFTTRIGGNQTRAFVAGIRGVATGASDAVAVVIDSNGQLGTVSSSRRFKQDIEDLSVVAARLQQLRPVQFRYREPDDDGRQPIQYGLIAEEVAEVLPALVAHGADGQIETVKYHVLPSLLIAEVQRLERARAAQAREIAELRAQIHSLLSQR